MGLQQSNFLRQFFDCLPSLEEKAWEREETVHHCRIVEQYNIYSRVLKLLEVV